MADVNVKSAIGFKKMLILFGIILSAVRVKEIANPITKLSMKALQE